MRNALILSTVALFTAVSMASGADYRGEKTYPVYGKQYGTVHANPRVTEVVAPGFQWFTSNVIPDAPSIENKDGDPAYAACGSTRTTFPACPGLGNGGN